MYVQLISEFDIGLKKNSRRWGERASVRGERERGLIFEEYGVVFDVQVLSRLRSFCLLSVCFHRSAVKQKTQAYLAQLI